MPERSPEPGEPAPGLTQAEQAVVHHYLRAIDLLGRMNPSRESGRLPTVAYVQASQALVAAARELELAVAEMMRRGEDEVFAPTLTRAMLLLDGERRSSRTQVRDDTGGADGA